MEHMEHIGGYTLRQDDSLPMLGTDSLLLSKFVRLRRGDKVLDLGCGVGVLGILLAERCEGLTLDGIELNSASAALARRNWEENRISGIIHHGDLREKGWLTEGHYDLVVCNPPYFPAGSGFTATRRNASARTELDCTLADICRAAAPRLKTGGCFGVVCRVERLTDLMVSMRENALEPKRMKLVQTSPAKPPKLVLLEGVRQGKPGLKIEIDE